MQENNDRKKNTLVALFCVLSDAYKKASDLRDVIGCDRLDPSTVHNSTSLYIGRDIIFIVESHGRVVKSIVFKL